MTIMEAQEMLYGKTWDTTLKVEMENIVGEDKWYRALTKIDKLNIRREDETEEDGFFRATYTVGNNAFTIGHEVEDEVNNILSAIVNEWQEENPDYEWEVEYSAFEE